MPCSAGAAGNAPDAATAAGLVAEAAASPGAAFRTASGAQIKKALAIMSLSDCILPQQIHPPNSPALFSRSFGRKLKDTAEMAENHKPFLENSHTNFARLSHSSLGKNLARTPPPRLPLPSGSQVSSLRQERLHLDAAMPCRKSWRPNEFEMSADDVRIYSEIYPYFPVYTEGLL